MYRPERAVGYVEDIRWLGAMFFCVVGTLVMTSKFAGEQFDEKVIDYSMIVLLVGCSNPKEQLQFRYL